MDNIENSNFIRLLGIWTTSGNIRSGKTNLKLTGTDTYERILEGNYILHKAKVTMGGDNSETVELIKSKSTTDMASMFYFNSKGEDGIMHSTIINNDFKIEGDGLKFIGIINEDNSEINGKWYQAENDNWTEFIDLKLVKQMNT